MLEIKVFYTLNLYYLHYVDILPTNGFSNFDAGERREEKGDF
jgi:hypothetical protein